MMKWMRGVVSSVVLISAGCAELSVQPNGDASVRSNSTTYVVTVGMENSSFAGACPGAGIDAQRMTTLLSNYTANIKAFSSSTATKSAVKAAMMEAVEKAELFIFYYSGHGGQGRMKWIASDESDGLDEYLCLYDTYMLDDEVWNIISKSKGRVMCIFDACHSETIFKVENPFTLKLATPLGVTHNETGPINLLVWSGCPEHTYSYGSALGGQMTNTLLKYFNDSETYDQLWERLESDSTLKSYEIVQRTLMGTGFTSKPIFQ